MNIKHKNGKKYLVVKDKAIEFKEYDEKGLPIIKPKITKWKDKKGKEHVKVEIPALQLINKQIKP